MICRVYLVYSARFVPRHGYVPATTKYEYSKNSDIRNLVIRDSRLTVISPENATFLYVILETRIHNNFSSFLDKRESKYVFFFKSFSCQKATNYNYKHSKESFTSIVSNPDNYFGMRATTTPRTRPCLALSSSSC